MAGVGNMPYSQFTIYNIVGGTAWVLVGLLSGFFFGNLPFIRNNFSLVILAIVFISLIPAVLEFIKHKRT
jgi:membrane-associated protein